VDVKLTVRQGREEFEEHELRATPLASLAGGVGWLDYSGTRRRIHADDSSAAN